jgi:hypothetical protein
MASAGVALGAAGALGTVMTAAFLVSATVVTAAAAALTVQSLALMLCFGCTVGYGLGGLGTSSFNNIHWNESSARAGAFLGGAIQVVAIAATMGYVGWNGLDGYMLLYHAECWGYIQTGFTYAGYASMVYDVISGNTPGHLYSMAQFGLRDILIFPQYSGGNHAICCA